MKCMNPLSSMVRSAKSTKSIKSMSSNSIVESVDAVYGLVERVVAREAGRRVGVASSSSSSSSSSAKRRQPFTIIVEGNIGSGKTTFLKHFKKFPEVCVVDEPVERWRNAGGHNLFDLMYSNPTKHAFSFQSYVQLTMLQLHTQPVEEPVKLMERSIFSAKYCFVNNLKRQGLLSGVEYAVLDEWFGFLRGSVEMRVDLIVYLRTNPATVHSRILERGRPEESSVTLEYLQSIHELHEEWLVGRREAVPCPVLTIDANEDLASMKRNYESCEETIFQRSRAAAAAGACEV